MRETYRRGELEGRNRQLPADLNQSVAFNANQRARENFDSTPVGTPPVCYDVRSVYDSRPINAYDFHITQFNALTSADTSTLVEMTVPEGYAAVLRGLEIWFEPAPLGVNRSDASFSLTLNGGDYPNNVNVLIGADTNGLLPMFMLADEFNRIGARLRFASYPDDTAIAYVHFYGNFLLKSNRALPFEIANPSGDPTCRPAPVTRTPTPRTPTPAPVTRTLPAPAPAPAPVPAFRPAPTPRVTVPPYPVQWRAAGMGNNAQLIPMQNDRGQRRDLSLAEVKLYLPFLNAQKMSGKEREMWMTFLRSVGVA